MIAAYATIVAVAFAVERPELFSWYFRSLLILEAVGGIGGFLSKPLGLCERCFAGQLAFWWSVAEFGWAPWPQHIVTSCAAILLTAATTKAYTWIKQ